MKYHMIWVLLLIFWGAIHWPVKTMALEPPPPIWLRYSANNQYVFVIIYDEKFKQYDPQQRDYPASGMYKNDGSLTPLWTYEGPKLNGFIVMDDGKSVVGYEYAWMMMNPDDTWILIAREGKMLSQFTASDLGFAGHDSEMQHPVASYRYVYEDEDQASTLAWIILHDSEYERYRLWFDLRTGELVKAWHGPRYPVWGHQMLRSEGEGIGLWISSNERLILLILIPFVMLAAYFIGRWRGRRMASKKMSAMEKLQKSSF